jgi:hypothetical protein
MTRPLLRNVLVGFVILGGFYVIAWLAWKNGSILRDEEWQNMLNKSRIVVRQLPSSSPFWALPISFIPDENPQYRCELYRYGTNTMFSAQTFSGDSFRARDAHIEWDGQGGGVIYLDKIPVLICDSQGFWSKAQSSP